MPGNIQRKKLYIIPSAFIFMLVRMGTRTLPNELCHLPYIHSSLPPTRVCVCVCVQLDDGSPYSHLLTLTSNKVLNKT